MIGTGTDDSITHESPVPFTAELASSETPAVVMTVSELLSFMEVNRGIREATSASYRERLLRMAKLLRAWKMVNGQSPEAVPADSETIASVALRLEDEEDTSLEFVRDSAVLIPLLEIVFPSKATLRYMLYAARLGAEVAVGDKFLAAAYTSALRKLSQHEKSPREPRLTRSMLARDTSSNSTQPDQDQSSILLAV
jgi:hypothetical protein